MTGNQLLNALTAREREKNPVKIALAGAGFVGRGLVNQVGRMQGLRVLAIANRRPEKAEAVLQQVSSTVKYRRCRDPESLNKTLRRGEIGIVTDPLLLAEAEVDIVVDCTNF